MRIRKSHTAKPSRLLLPFARVNPQTHVCELNRSPWDVQPLVMAFPQQQLHFTNPIQNQTSWEENATMRKGRERSGVVSESSVAVLQDTGDSEVEDEEGKKVEVIESKDESSLAQVRKSGDSFSDSGTLVPYFPAVGKPKQKKRVSRLTGEKKFTAEKPKKSEIAADGEIAKKMCSGEDSDELRVCCKRKDGKRWQCSRAVKFGHSLCEHHLAQMRSYYPSGYRNTDNSNCKDGGAIIAGVCHRNREKTSDSGEYYYYYTGFGPLWKKRRGEGSRVCATETTTETPHMCDDNDEETDDDEGEKKQKNKKKRKRKAMKARSLKSLLQFSSVAMSNETGGNAIH